MDFRTNKTNPISPDAETNRNYGIYDNLVFVYDKPLTDEQIQSINAEIRRHAPLNKAKQKAELEADVKAAIKKAFDEIERELRQPHC